ncbi:MAG: tetratricopeptide repeat protein [Rhodospirillaceae bacterium]|nr:tetratricopeptide repeat protein [Rhodospirillales bacterium]
MEAVFRLIQAGDLKTAKAELKRQLASHPTDSQRVRLLGKIVFHQGDMAGGIKLLRRACALAPDMADFHYELGVMLLTQGQWNTAAESFRQALTLAPTHIDSLYNYAWVLRQQGQADEAANVLRRLLKDQPGHAQGWFNLANILGEAGDLEGAAQAYENALAAAPNHTGALNNLGDIRHRQGRAEDALQCYARALAVDPDLTASANNMGNALTALGRADEAVPVYETMLARHPGDAKLLYNLALALVELRHLDAAAQRLEQTVAAAPHMAEAWNALGSIQMGRDEPAAAERALSRALALRPEFADAYSNLGKLHSLSGRTHEGCDCFRHALALEPDNAAIHSNYLFLLRHMPEVEPEQVFEEHRRFGERQEALATELAKPEISKLTDGYRRLRIGYVSPDFCQHAVMMLFLPVLERHDHQNFEIFCYHTSTRVDAVTRRVAELADQWRPIAHLSADAAATLIRNDGIDILIDLAGHSARNGLPIFARKPAYLQATWLGYPGTTGLTRMDYRMTDGGADWPPGRNDRFYTEGLVFLKIAAVFRPPPHAPAVQPLPMLTGIKPRLGAFNKVTKLNDRVIAVWSRILQRVPNAELFMVMPGGEQPSVAEDMRQRFARHGIHGERLVISGLLPLDRFMDLVASVDLALDPFPYCGGSTSMITLWLGVAMISRHGEDAASSTGHRLLNGLGLGELAAPDDDAYVSIACELIADPARLSRLRTGLRPLLQASPLLDEDALVKDVERNYRGWWLGMCAARDRSRTAALAPQAIP